MKRYVELEVEHHYKNKFIGRHLLRSTDRTVVLGQARDAGIRLMGEDVSPNPWKFLQIQRRRLVIDRHWQSDSGTMG